MGWREIHRSRTPLITAVASLLTAAIGGFFAWVVARKKAKTDVQSTLNSGFQILINEFQEERVGLIVRIKDSENLIKEIRASLTEAEGRIRKLENVLTEHGIAIPN